jgi:transforming growth factor-beta-induced protein
MFRFAPLVLACLLAPAFGQTNSTIVDLAVATPSLSTLVTAVTAADLVTALGNPDATLTVFAPDNDAFAKLPTGLVSTLLSAGFKKHLTDILTYHVYATAAVLSADLAATQNITMLNGEMLTVTKTDTTVTVTTTLGQMQTVIMADVQASNGVVHVIDGVLVPSSIMATIIDLGSDYSTLLSLITRAGLDTTLMGGPFTLLAPTNEAFAALDTATVDFLTSTAGAATLTSILTYHVISGSVTSDMLMNGMMVKTVEGGEVTFMVAGGTVMVNDATVVMADMLAFNGVSHGIDKILMPPAASMAPTTAPGGGFEISHMGGGSMAPTMTPMVAMGGMGGSPSTQISDMSGSLAVGASLSAVFAAVLAVAL